MKDPKYAKTITELASLTGVSRSAIHSHLKRPHNPGRTRTGRFSIQKWREYFGDHLGSSPSDTPETLRLKKRRLALDNDKREIELEILRGERIPQGEIEKLGAEVGSFVKQSVLQTHLLAPLLAGLPVEEIEARLREFEREVYEGAEGMIAERLAEFGGLKT